MSKNVLHIEKVYTFHLPDFFGKRESKKLIKISKELAEYLEAASKEFGVSQNALINFYLWEGLKLSGAQIKESYDTVGETETGFPIWADEPRGRLIKFSVPYKKSRNRHFSLDINKLY